MKNKQYIFGFNESSGWNTVWAKTIRGAKKAAIEQCKEYDTLTPDLDSVRIATDEGLRAAMSLFY